MTVDILISLALPFIGTLAGALLAMFIRCADKTKRILGAFGGGIMMAASVWSLIIPAIELSEPLAPFAFLPAAVGFLLGIFCMICTDILLYNIEGREVGFEKGADMLSLAVTIHNFPEGMALGAALGAVLNGAETSEITVMALAFGIAMQNVPEGAIIVLPHTDKKARIHAFAESIGSAATETLGALLMIALSGIIAPVLPYALAFAAGAMVYVVVEELIPEAKGYGIGKISLGSIAFSIGFTLMMALDVAFG